MEIEHKRRELSIQQATKVKPNHRTVCMYTFYYSDIECSNETIIFLLRCVFFFL